MQRFMYYTHPQRWGAEHKRKDKSIKRTENLMSRKNIIAIISLMLTTLVSSCINDDSTEIEYYDDAAITSFSLGKISRTIYTKNAAGKDTVYVSTISCSGYQFSIDHASGRIFNNDSLPTNMQMNKSLATIYTKNAGYVYVKNIHNDSLKAYSETDTLDLSIPRTLRCYANDGSWYKDYVVDVRVHKEAEDSVYWNRMADNAGIAKMESMKALHFNNKIIAYGVTDGSCKAFATSNTDGNSWQELSTPETSKMSMTTDGTLLYALTADAKIYGTADAEQWTEIAQNTQLKALVAASRTEIYAISNDGKLMKSDNQGATWSEEHIDDDVSMLPEDNFNSVTSVSLTNNDIDKVVLIGTRNNATDSTCVVWSKTVDVTTPAKTQPWMYQEYDNANRHKAPALENLCIAPYNNGMIMIGGKGIGTCKALAFDRILFSYDNGQNWWGDERFYLPKDMRSSEKSFAIVADSNNFLWILCGETGQIWKGHLSQLTWK